jgi:integrase
VVHNGINPTTGQPRRRRLGTFATITDARKAAREAVKKKEQGELPDAGKLTLSQWLDQWIGIKKSQVEPATHNFYVQRVKAIKSVEGFSGLQISKIKPLDVEGMHTALTGRGVSAGEQRKIATTLRTALKSAKRHKLIFSNPADDVDRPRADDKPARSMDESQARRFLNASRADRLAGLWALWLDSGCRPGELFGLHWQDVNLDANTIFVHQSLEEINGHCRLKSPKTKKGRRYIRLARRTVEVLLAHRERMRAEGRDVESGPVFCNTEGNWLKQPNVYRRNFLPILRRAKLPHFRPYDLRHTSATLLLARGVNIKAVSERLGHQDINTTLKHYAHVLDTMQEKAAAAVQEIFGSVAVECPINVPQQEESDVAPAGVNSVSQSYK